MQKKEIKITNKPREKEYYEIENISNQTINIQLKSSGNEVLLGEQTISLKSRESAEFPADRLYMNIVENLKRTKHIRARKINQK